MKLIPISERPDHVQILWDLLSEREPHVNISHKEMPTWDDHAAFVASEPYEAWYLIEEIPSLDEGTRIVGAVYLTWANEIGVHIFKQWSRQGFGYLAVFFLMKIHGQRRYLANVAPCNEASRKMFAFALGFNLVQETYASEH